MDCWGQRDRQEGTGVGHIVSITWPHCEVGESSVVGSVNDQHLKRNQKKKKKIMKRGKVYLVDHVVGVVVFLFLEWIDFSTSSINNPNDLENAHDYGSWFNWKFG